jgi:hypothetical protein
MTDTDKKQPEKPDRHPVAEAAWRGYREYKEDMAKRRAESSLHRLSIPTMLWTAGILIAFIMVVDYLKRAGWWDGVSVIGIGQ